MFRHLVICRLFNPGSKLRTVDPLRRYLGVFYDVEAVYKFLDNLCFRKEKDCKKGKHACPQIFLGLLVAAGGRSTYGRLPKQEPHRL